MKKKIVFLLLIAVCLLSSLSLVSAAKKEIRVAVMLPNVGDVYFQKKWYGYSTAAEQLGVKALLYDAGGYANVSKQISQVEDVVQMGVDAIIYHPCHSEAGVPVIEEAIRQGIKVVNDNQPCPAPSIHTTIMIDFFATGRAYAQWVALDSKGKGKVLILPGPVGGDQNIRLLEGQLELFRRFPEIEILDIQYCESNVAAGLKLMEDLIQAHPDVEYITCFADQLTQGVIQALRAAGKKPGEIKVLGFNMSDQTKRLFEEGWISVLGLSRPVDMARQSMELAVKLVKGEKVPEMTWIYHDLFYRDMMDVIDLKPNSVPDGWRVRF